MREKEERIEMIYPLHMERPVLQALRASHPYEEIAYDLFAMTNEWPRVGSGMMGELEHGMTQEDFLAMVKKQLKADVIRYTPVGGKTIKKVAVCGGSGSFLLGAALSSGADAFVTADFKYHQFFDGEGKILITDV